MTKWKQEVICSICFLVFCLINWIYAGYLPKSNIKVLAAQPDLYLKGWLGILALLSIIIMIRALKNKPKEVMPPIWCALGVFTIMALALYLLLMPYLGFYISSFVFLSSLVVAYTLKSDEKENKKRRKWKELPMKKIVVCIFFCAIGTALIEYLFRNVLSVFLPSFSLF